MLGAFEQAALNRMRERWPDSIPRAQYLEVVLAVVVEAFRTASDIEQTSAGIDRAAATGKRPGTRRSGA